MGIPKHQHREEVLIIMQQGGVGAIVSAMRSHVSVAAVQEKWCGALMRHADNAENRVPAREMEEKDFKSCNEK